MQKKKRYETCKLNRFECKLKIAIKELNRFALITKDLTNSRWNFKTFRYLSFVV